MQASPARPFAFSRVPQPAWARRLRHSQPFNRPRPCDSGSFMKPTRQAGPLAAATRLMGARPEEAQVVLLSCAYFFFILSAYYVLRPIRDAMGVAGGVSNIPWLFTGTLTGMLLVHPLFAALVSRWPRRRFVTLTYRFFMANLVVFFFLLRFVSEGASVWAGRAFFVWLSVFNLFVVSVFWSFMTDIFRERQSRRLFGFIGVGGTIGGIVGSSVTAFLATALTPVTLLWFSILLLEGAVWCVKRLDRYVAGSARGPSERTGDAGPAPATAMHEVIGGSAMDGIRRVAASPYLLGIAAFMLLFTVGSTFLYQVQADIISRHFPTDAERTAVFARIDLAVNLLTLLTQAFLTHRLVKWLGVGRALALMPALSVVGFAVLGTTTALAGIGTTVVLAVFVVFQVIRRGGEFALARPVREMLYTVLSRSDKYKAKNFNDTFVYRTGDQIGAWSFPAIGALGAGTAATVLVIVPLSVVWLLVALWLGRQQVERRARAKTTGG